MDKKLLIERLNTLESNKKANENLIAQATANCNACVGAIHELNELIKLCDEPGEPTESV
jgi:hypothetical protein